jgi:hypothetical protein
MKKLIIIMIALSSSMSYGRGHGHHFHHCHGRWIGPAIVGGLVGSALINSYRSPAVVYTQPTYIHPYVAPVSVTQVPTIINTPTVITQPQPIIIHQQPRIQRVWVEGRYVDKVDIKGNVVRVWEPGYYKEVIINN